jgi:hypothetical protein
MAAASLLSTSAFVTFVTTPGTPYATQAVSAASGALTISAQPTYTGTATGSGTFLITFGLPSGVLFSGTPSVAVDGKVCTVGNLYSGGNGNNTPHSPLRQQRLGHAQ